ncbi:MAG: hypothetical protein ABSB88_00935 [Bryobacteraceae bacterium]
MKIKTGGSQLDTRGLSIVPRRARLAGHVVSGNGSIDGLLSDNGRETAFSAATILMAITAEALDDSLAPEWSIHPAACREARSSSAILSVSSATGRLLYSKYSKI